MNITSKQVEYKTANYRIQVEWGIREADGKTTSDVAVFDLNNNLIASFSSIKEAETLSREVLEVLEQLKI